MSCTSHSTPNTLRGEQCVPSHSAALGLPAPCWILFDSWIPQPILPAAGGRSLLLAPASSWSSSLGSQTANAPRPCSWRCLCQFVSSHWDRHIHAAAGPPPDLSIRSLPCPGQLSPLPQHGLPHSPACCCDLLYPVLLYLLLLFLAVSVQAGNLLPCAPRLPPAPREPTAPHRAACRSVPVSPHPVLPS